MEPSAILAGDGIRPKWEVADVFRLYGKAYRRAHALPLSHLKVMHAIEVCRTAYLGGHMEQCDRCNRERPAYNSCRNRHCPKCQALAKARWVQARCADLLPVEYYHGVFTLPHDLNALAGYNKRVIFDLLFKSVSETLQEFAADPKHKLNGKLGITAILHTWDQRLLQHIHLHCVIPAGALSFDHKRWTPARKKFLFPVKALSRKFRGKYIDLLKRAHAQGQLKFSATASEKDFPNLIRRLWEKDWVVYTKAPFGGPKQVLDYLGRYTHRVAIYNQRVRQVADGKVSFSYHDRKDGNKVKIQTLGAFAFIHRFLLHVLPKSYVRIRHFGLLAGRTKSQNLERCRELLGTPPVKKPQKKNTHDLLLELTGIDPDLCPFCRRGRMKKIRKLPEPCRRRDRPQILDSS